MLKKALKGRKCEDNSSGSICPTPTTTCPEAKFDFNLM
jgi:hypothetical protein